MKETIPFIKKNYNNGFTIWSSNLETLKTSYEVNFTPYTLQKFQIH